MEDPLVRVALAFNASDPLARLELLEASLSEAAEVAHVHGESRGPRPFADAIAEIQRSYGPLVAELGTQQVLGRWVRRPWTLAKPDGVFARGAYVARLGDDGRITHLLSLPDEIGTG